MASSPTADRSRTSAFVARARGRLSGTPRELRLLLVVGAILGVAWTVVVPPFQGPDEPTHVSYTQQLSETGTGPFQDRGERPVSTEIGIALEEYGLGALTGVRNARPPRTELQERQWEARSEALTDAQRSDGTGPSPLARNPQLYYVFQAIPYLALGGADLFDRLVAMRLANVLLFLLTIALTWLLAVELFGRDARLRVFLATAIVAMWPMLAFMAGIVNPDTALVTAYTAVLVCAVRLVRRGPSLGRVVALWLTAAITMLVHGRGLASLGVVLAALLVTAIGHRPLWRRLALWTGAGALLAAVPLALSKLVLAPGSGGGLYGGEATIPTSAFSIRQLFSQIWQFYLDRLWFMSPRLGPDYGYRQVVVERFFAGVFGSLEVTYPTWVYDLAQYGIVALVVAVWTAAVIHRERLWRHWPVVLTLAALPLGLMLLLQTASYRALLFGVDPLITGSYLLPLAPLVAGTGAWLVGALPRRARGWAAGGVVVVLLLMQFGALGMTVVRFHV